MIGVKTLRTRSRATVKSGALVIAAFQNECSCHGSCFKNLSKAYASSRLFWMIVPETHHRRSARNRQQALDATVAIFLMQCASSRMTRFHECANKPLKGGRLEDTCFCCRTCACNSPWRLPSASLDYNIHNGFVRLSGMKGFDSWGKSTIRMYLQVVNTTSTASKS